MRATTIVSGLVASLALIAAPLGAADNDATRTVGDRNAKVLADVPMKARDGLIKAADGREITGVDRSEDQGKVVYQAKIKRDGPDLRVKVDEDGKVVWRSDERNAGSQSGALGRDEDAKDRKDRMQQHAERDVEKAKRDADRAERDAERKADRAEHDADQAKRGDRDDDHLSLDAIPAPAREAIKREADGRELRDLERSTKHGKTVYEAEVDLGDGKQREIKVAEDGTVLKSHED